VFANTPWVSLVVGGWCALNGVLHESAVIVKHEGPYDRDFLRLLLDGHILITCGLMQMTAWVGLRSGAPWAFAVSGIATLSLLVYCGLIFPFLKSFVTIFLNAVLILFLAGAYLQK